MRYCHVDHTLTHNIQQRIYIQVSLHWFLLTYVFNYYLTDYCLLMLTHCPYLCYVSEQLCSYSLQSSIAS